MKRIVSHIYSEFSFLCSLPAVLWQFIFMVAPLGIVFYYSVTSMDSMISLANYAALFKKSYFLIIGRSLFFAFSIAILSLIAAYPVAYFLAFKVKRFKNLLLFLLTLPLWVNFLIQVYAWYFLLERDGIINSLLLKIGCIAEPLQLANNQYAMFLVMFYCYLPFMILPLYSVLEKFDMRLFEASADLGATSWQTFTRVTLPLSFPGIKTGFFLVLIPAFGEFVIPSLLGGSKYMMVGTLISYLFLVARNNGLGAAFTCLSVVILLCSLFIMYLVGYLRILKTMAKKS